MSYIVRVVGYNAYWTGSTDPGKCWSTTITDSRIFDVKEEAQVIVNSGTNMEVVEYDFAFSDRQQDIVDWDAVDEKSAEIQANKNQNMIPLSDFETVSEEVQQVDVEVLD